VKKSAPATDSLPDSEPFVPGEGRWRVLRPDGSECVLVLRHRGSFFGRLRGLIGRPAPAPGHGLWLVPCNAVHSFGMRAPIDLLFVDRQGRVLSVQAHFMQWRAAACRAARSTIEMQAGEAARLRIAAGSRLIGPLPPPSFDFSNRWACTPSSSARPHLEQEPFMAVDKTPKASRKISSRSSARAAALAAVAAASLVTSPAQADANANMNLGYEFLDQASDEPREPLPEKAVSHGASDESAISESAISESAISEGAVPETSVSARGSGTSAPASGPAAGADPRLADAEQLYRDGRYAEALPLFRAIVASDPAHAHAWLRIGNLMHRKRDWFDALTAYRRAARPGADAVIREKAVYNVALLNLELARQALKRLERLRSDQTASAAGARGPESSGIGEKAVRSLSEEIGATYNSLAALGREAGPVAAVSTARAPAPAPRPGPRAAKPPALEKPVQVEIRQGGVSP
jgi:uncharacterized membrane protein (UPF0127 family)/tetratricopeptide (TPR) repeat protein